MKATRDLIRTAMKEVRSAHFARPDPRPDPNVPVIYWEETCFRGQPYMVPLVILRTRPCRWFSTGGCVMCNYELMAVDEGVEDENIVNQAKYAIAQLQDLSKYPYLLLTSQGSFFDDNEVPASLRSQVLAKFWDAGLRAVSTESEARYCLDGVRLKKIRSSFPGRISVGIGLEAADEFIRNAIINKGLPNAVFYKAIEQLAQSDISFYTYVSLGKPFLTAEEDLSDAVRAIEMSLSSGAQMVVVEMINIQPYTLTETLWKRGLYETCDLWRGVELLSRITPELRQSVSIKGFEADVSPTPLALAKSCPACDQRLRTALNNWNFTRDYDALLQAVMACTSCSGGTRHDQLYDASMPLDQRVALALS